MSDGQPVEPKGAGEVVLYATEDGQAQVFLRAEGGTVWLSQAELAALFQTTKQNISLHIRNVLAEGELLAGATVKDHLTVQTEGKRQVRRSMRLQGASKVSRGCMEQMDYERYAAFDAQWRQADARAANADDIAELEQAERQLAKKGEPDAA